MNQLFDNEVSAFPTAYSEILYRMKRVKPIKYGKTRNFINGAVTYLSPYISRGVISTAQVFEWVKEETPYSLSSMEKFIQELAWRDYWQQVWRAKGDLINTDLKHTQAPITNTAMPLAVDQASTGITAIDRGIERLYQSGYMHNHLRMYTAAICCNVGQSHWKTPARWMYYHLLDADWASNALSWQWVAGANSNKKYYANQENINRYCFTDQRGSFLDVGYEEFAQMPVPSALQETTQPDMTTSLPEAEAPVINQNLPTFLYNFYNLDPQWSAEVKANRVLLLEPSHFEKYPISPKTMEFILDLSQNIKGIQLFVGEFSGFKTAFPSTAIHYKEHPLNKHYEGYEEARDWMFSVEGDFRSFFAFWKKCKKELKGA